MSFNRAGAGALTAAAAAAADDVFIELTDEFADVLELERSCCLVDDGGSCFDPIRKARREAERAAELQQSADAAAGIL